MNFNGDTPGDFADGGLMTGSLEITDDLKVGDSITLDGKYTLPVTAPIGPNNVITSDGTDQLIWTGDLSVGDVSSVTTSTVDGEIVLFNGTGGKSIKNSSKVISDFITNPLDRTSNDAAAAQISVRKAHGPGGYVQNGDQITRYSSSAFRQLSSIYAVTGWHQWEATEDHINSSGSRYSVWSTNNGDTIATRKLEIDTDGISMLDTLKVKSGVVNIDSATNAAITHSISGVGKWQVGNIGSDNYQIKNPNTLIVPLEVDSLTDKITISGKMAINDDLNVVGNIFTDKIYIGQDTNHWRTEGLNGGNLGLDTFDELNQRALLVRKGDMTMYNNAINSQGCTFQFRKRRGVTETNVDAVLNGDTLLRIVGSGYSSTGTGFRETAAIEMKATEDYNATDNGGDMTFYTTANGTATRLERMKIEESGVIKINGGTDSFDLPQSRGTDRQVLTTDGAGIASWDDVPTATLGELYISGSTTETVISNVGQHVPLAGTFTMAYNNGFQATTAAIFTYQGTKQRIFKVDSTYSFSRVAPGASGIDWSISLYKNGSILPGGTVEKRTDGSTDIVSTSLCNLVTLSNGDFVAVRVANLTDTTNVIFKHVTYNIIGLT